MTTSKSMSILAICIVAAACGGSDGTPTADGGVSADGGIAADGGVPDAGTPDRQAFVGSWDVESSITYTFTGPNASGSMEITSPNQVDSVVADPADPIGVILSIDQGACDIPFTVKDATSATIAVGSLCHLDVSNPLAHTVDVFDLTYTAGSLAIAANGASVGMGMNASGSFLRHRGGGSVTDPGTFTQKISGTK